MDSSQHAAINAQPFLHAPVLNKAEMRQTLALPDPRCSLGADVPADLFDRATASNFKPPSHGEGVKKETVINIFHLYQAWMFLNSD